MVGMLRLIRLDVTRLLRDARLVSAMAAFGWLLLLSGIASFVDVQQAAATKNAVAAEERQRWLTQGEKDPHSAAHYSVYAFKPSAALQALDPGVAPFVGETVWLEAHQQNDLLSRPQQDAHPFERLGLVDPAGLLTRFGPLVVFLLAFAAAAREREDGVLGLALGTASARGTYVGAKVGSVIVLSLLVLVLPIVLVGVASLVAPVDRTVDQTARLAAWAAAASSYVAVLAMVGVSLCLMVRTAHIALAGLLAVWIVMVLAALPGASAIAEWSRPLPSFQQMKLVLADEAPAYWTPESGAEQIASILQRYGASSADELTINLRAAQLDVAERHAQSVFDREIGGFYNRVIAQDQSYASLGWLSPAVAFDAASAALTGTDFTHHRDFIDYAEQYRRNLVNRMNADIIPRRAVDGREATSDIDLWAQVPAFAYTPLPLSIGVRPTTAALTALACWLLAGVILTVATAAAVRP